MLGQCATDFPVQILFFNRITLGFRYRVGLLGHYATDFSEFFFLQEITARGGEMAIKMAPTAVGAEEEAALAKALEEAERANMEIEGDSEEEEDD